MSTPPPLLRFSPAEIRSASRTLDSATANLKVPALEHIDPAMYSILAKEAAGLTEPLAGQRANLLLWALQKRGQELSDALDKAAADYRETEQQNAEETKKVDQALSRRGSGGGGSSGCGGGGGSIGGGGGGIGGGMPTMSSTPAMPASVGMPNLDDLERKLSTPEASEVRLGPAGADSFLPRQGDDQGTTPETSPRPRESFDPSSPFDPYKPILRDPDLPGTGVPEPHDGPWEGTPGIVPDPTVDGPWDPSGPGDDTPIPPDGPWNGTPEPHDGPWEGTPGIIPDPTIEPPFTPNWEEWTRDHGFVPNAWQDVLGSQDTTSHPGDLPPVTPTMPDQPRKDQ